MAVPCLTRAPPTPVRAGWDVRGAVRKIWAGERRLAAVQQDKDAGSRAAIKAILFHAVQHDNNFGKKTLPI